MYRKVGSMIVGVSGRGIGEGPSATPDWLGRGKARISGRGGLAMAEFQWLGDFAYRQRMGMRSVRRLLPQVGDSRGL